ncbi:MAG: hypothetical protein NC397_05830 [Clostridium sp.]|nr:hypothetical protein [Clostridium sp.]
MMKKKILSILIVLAICLGVTVSACTAGHADNKSKQYAEDANVRYGHYTASNKCVDIAVEKLEYYDGTFRATEEMDVCYYPIGTEIVSGDGYIFNVYNNDNLEQLDTIVISSTDAVIYFIQDTKTLSRWPVAFRGVESGLAVD